MITLDMYKGMRIADGFEKAWTPQARAAAILARSAKRHSMQADETNSRKNHERAVTVHREAEQAFKKLGSDYKVHAKYHKEEAQRHNDAALVAAKKEK